MNTRKTRRLRVVLYARVSSDRRKEATSVESQLTNLRKLAKREGWIVVATFRDDGIGASKYSKGTREGWPEVAAMIAAGEVDMLAVWSLARATRDRVVYAALMAACESNAVRFNLAGRYLDPADPDEAFSLDVDAAVAIRQAGVMSKDIKRGHATAAANGRPFAHNGWYLRRVYDEHTKALVAVELIEDRARLLADAARKILDSGATLTAEAKKINDAGVDPDKTFTARRLRTILLSPSLAGQRVHQGRIVGKAMWPAVVDMPTHRRLVKLLTQESRRTHEDNAVKHLLTGVALCGSCGATMRRIAGRKRPPRLTCSKHHHVSMLEDGLTEYVETIVIRRLQRDDVLDAWKPKAAAKKTTSKSVAKLKDDLAAWEDAAAEGTLTPAAFGRIEAKILAKIEQAEREAEPQEIPAVLVKVTAGDVPKNWKALSIKEQREVITLIGAPAILPGRAAIHVRVVFPWEDVNSENVA